MNEQSSKNNGNGSSSSFGQKAGLIGAGVLIGLVAYPFVKKALGVVQPKIDDLLDGLTGKAEGLAEKASDMIFKAKENLKKDDHSNCDHDHGSSKT